MPLNRGYLVCFLNIFNFHKYKQKFDNTFVTACINMLNGSESNKVNAEKNILLPLNIELTTLNLLLGFLTVTIQHVEFVRFR